MEKKRAVTIGGLISVLPFFCGLIDAVLGDAIALQRFFVTGDNKKTAPGACSRGGNFPLFRSV